MNGEYARIAIIIITVTGAILITSPPLVIIVQTPNGLPAQTSPTIPQHGNGQVAMERIIIGCNGDIPVVIGMILQAAQSTAHGAMSPTCHPAPHMNTA